MSPAALLSDPRAPKWFLRATVTVLCAFSIWAAQQLWAGGEQGVAQLKEEVKILDRRTDGHGARLSAVEVYITESKVHQRDFEARIDRRLDQVMDYLLKIEKRTR